MAGKNNPSIEEILEEAVKEIDFDFDEENEDDQASDGDESTEEVNDDQSDADDETEETSTESSDEEDSDEEESEEEDTDADGEDDGADDDESVDETETEEEQVDPGNLMVEVKVNGVSEMKPIDEVVKGYQLGAVSTQRLQEAAEAKREAADAVKFQEDMVALATERPGLLASRAIYGSQRPVDESIADIVSAAPNPVEILNSTIRAVATLGLLPQEIIDAYNIPREDLQQAILVGRQRMLQQQQAPVAPQAPPQPKLSAEEQKQVDDLTQIFNEEGASQPAEQRALYDRVRVYANEHKIAGLKEAYDAMKANTDKTTGDDVLKVIRKVSKKVSEKAKTSSDIAPKGTSRKTPSAASKKNLTLEETVLQAAEELDAKGIAWS